MIAGVFSDDPERQTGCDHQSFVKLLSKREEILLIERVIECGVVVRFVEFLRIGQSMLQVGFEVRLSMFTHISFSLRLLGL